MQQELFIDDLPDNILQDKGVISRAFITQGLNDIRSAFRFVKQLPYRRNGDKAAACVVLNEGCGTCSTKHALLYRLAEEQGIAGFELYIGIFKMNEAYAPKLKNILQQHKLPYIPEAHCYLKYKGVILDCTSERSSAKDFITSLITEVVISPGQTGDFKVALQKQYMQQCLDTDSAFGNITPDELWAVRETCIGLLS